MVVKNEGRRQTDACRVRGAHGQVRATDYREAGTSHRAFYVGIGSARDSYRKRSVISVVGGAVEDDFFFAVAVDVVEGEVAVKIALAVGTLEGTKCEAWHEVTDSMDPRPATAGDDAL